MIPNPSPTAKSFGSTPGFVAPSPSPRMTGNGYAKNLKDLTYDEKAHQQVQGELKSSPTLHWPVLCSRTYSERWKVSGFTAYADDITLGKKRRPLYRNAE